MLENLKISGPAEAILVRLGIHCSITNFKAIYRSPGSTGLPCKGLPLYFTTNLNSFNICGRVSNTSSTSDQSRWMSSWKPIWTTHKLMVIHLMTLEVVVHCVRMSQSWLRVHLGGPLVERQIHHLKIQRWGIGLSLEDADGNPECDSMTQWTSRMKDRHKRTSTIEVL